MNASENIFCSSARSSPRQSCCLFFLLSSNQAYVELRVGVKEACLILLMLLSQRLDPSRNESYNLIKMCKCVDFFLAEGGWTPLHDPSLFFIFLGCGLSFFFFFWHALWACGIPSFSMHLFFFLFFFDMPIGYVAYLLWVCIFYFIIFFVFIVHILDGHFREKESWYVMEFYYVCGWKCLLSVSGRECDLDHENMTSL